MPISHWSSAWRPALLAVQYAIVSPQAVALQPGERGLICDAVALVILSIGCLQLVIDVSRNEIQKIRLAFRFGGAARLGYLVLGRDVSPDLIGLLALVGGLQVMQELFV